MCEDYRNLILRASGISYLILLPHSLTFFIAVGKLCPYRSLDCHVTRHLFSMWSARYSLTTGTCFFRKDFFHPVSSQRDYWFIRVVICKDNCWNLAVISDHLWLVCTIWNGLFSSVMASTARSSVVSIRNLQSEKRYKLQFHVCIFPRGRVFFH